MWCVLFFYFPRRRPCFVLSHLRRLNLDLVDWLIHWLIEPVMNTFISHISRMSRLPRAPPSVGRRSEGAYKLANVSLAWLGWFLCVFAICYRIQQAKIRQRCFKKILRFTAMLHFVWAVHDISDIFAPQPQQPDLPIVFRSVTPCFLFQPICCLHKEFGWDPFSSLGEIAILKLLKKFLKI